MADPETDLEPIEFGFDDTDRERWAAAAAAAVAAAALRIRKRMAANIGATIPTPDAVFQSAWWDDELDTSIRAEFEKIAGEAAAHTHEAVGAGKISDALRDAVASGVAAGIIGVMGGRGAIVSDRVQTLVDRETERATADVEKGMDASEAQSAAATRLTDGLGLQDNGTADASGPISEALTSDFGEFAATGLVEMSGLETLLQAGYTGEKTWNCVAADTVVAGTTVKAIARKWYEGEMVRVSTRSGVVLTVTPEHRVLTGRGWLRADALNERDHLYRGNVTADLTAEQQFRTVADGDGRDEHVRVVPATEAQTALLHDAATEAGAVLTLTEHTLPDDPMLGPLVDEITSIETVNYDGHVYDLSTDVGWFFADGVIVHNCSFINSRESHMDADQQTVALDDWFTLINPTYGESLGLAPFDPELPVWETANCACWCTYTLTPPDETTVDGEPPPDEELALVASANRTPSVHGVWRGRSRTWAVRNRKGAQRMIVNHAAAFADAIAPTDGTGPHYSDAVCVTVEPTPAEKVMLATPGGLAPGDLHLTVCYLGKVVDFDETARQSMAAALASVADQVGPFEGAIAGAGYFGSGDTAANIYLVDAEGLTGLHGMIVGALTAAGIDPSTAHDAFVPHVTSSYGGVAAPDRTGMPLHFNEIRLRFGTEVLAFDLLGPIAQPPESPAVPSEVAPPAAEVPMPETQPAAASIQLADGEPAGSPAPAPTAPPLDDVTSDLPPPDLSTIADDDLVAEMAARLADAAVVEAGQLGAEIDPAVVAGLHADAEAAVLAALSEVGAGLTEEASGLDNMPDGADDLPQTPVIPVPASYAITSHAITGTVTINGVSHPATWPAGTPAPLFTGGTGTMTLTNTFAVDLTGATDDEIAAEMARRAADRAISELTTPSFTPTADDVAAAQAAASAEAAEAMIDLVDAAADAVVGDDDDEMDDTGGPGDVGDVMMPAMGVRRQVRMDVASMRLLRNRTFTVTGDASLPIADRDHVWDGGAAAQRVAEWAKNADGTLDPTKYSRAFFYRDASQPDVNVGSYKLGFGDIVNGQLQAIPKGVFAVAGVLNGAMGGVDIPATDADGVKSRVRGFYERMASEFKDDTLKAPFDVEGLTLDVVPDTGRPFAVEGNPAPPTGIDYEWEGILCAEGVPTDDGRIMGEGSISWRQLPLPLAFLDKITSAHQEGAFCGTIHAIERRGNAIWGFGTIADNEAGNKMRAYLSDPKGAGRYGVSVDIGAASVVYASTDGTIMDEMEAEDAYYGGEKIMEMMTEGVLLGATLVMHPALAEANVWLCGPLPTIGTEDPPAVAASFGGTVWHTLRTGGLVPYGSDGVTALVASAGGDVQPAPRKDCFDLKPDSSEAFMVHAPDADGVTRVYGLVAKWGDCHIGFEGRCVTVPKSNDFSKFYAEPGRWQKFYGGPALSRFYAGNKCVLTREGEMVQVGPLILNTVHPNLARQASDTQPFYAHTGSAVADVRLYTNEHGIVAAGCIRADADPLAVRALRASDVSPDWRYIGGELKVLALLAVPVSGFQIEGIAASAGQFKPWASVDESTGEVMALVAAGAIHRQRPQARFTSDALSMMVATMERQSEQIAALEAQVAALSVPINRERAAKAMRVLALEPVNGATCGCSTS